MRNSTYTVASVFGLAIAVGLVACGSSSTAGGSGTGGTSATGGGVSASGSPATGGLAAAGGSKATAGASATGGSKAIGGGSSAAGAATGGIRNTGGMAVAGGATATGGTAAAGGLSSTGGSSGVSVIEQTCDNVAALLGTLSPPLSCTSQYDVTSCVSTYTELANADATCGSAYLDLLECGENQPASSWTCYSLSFGTININLPVPPSATATDACYTQFNSLFSKITGTAACLSAVSQ